LKASESNFLKAERTIEAEGSEYKDLFYEEQNESFDRFVKPASGPNPIVKVPTTWEENFTNGIKLIGSTDTEIPKINLQISIGAGHRFEFPGKAGEAKLLANLMNESTLLHSQQEIDGILSKIGSEVSIYSDENYIHIYVTCLKEKLNTTLQIVDEKIFKSKWDTSEFVRVKKELLNRIKNQAAQPVDIAENAYVKILYGKGHIMSLPENGTEETISSIKMSDVKLYRENYFSPFSTKIVVSGDITKASLIAQIKFLIDWQGKKTIKPYENEIPKIEKTKIYFINKKGAAQSEIRIGFMSLPYDVVGNFYKLKIANFALSGNFNSRLNIQLRETRGYTYGTRGTLKGGLFSGPYTIYGGIKANATDTALMDYMKIIRNYVDVGITDEELQFTKNALGQSEALRYEAPNQKINFLTQLLEYNLSKDFTKKQKLVLAAISKEEINLILKKYMEIDNLNIIVVGDKETLFERVKKLGYEMIELDVNGNPITRAE
jgi:zinc protease